MLNPKSLLLVRRSRRAASGRPFERTPMPSPKLVLANAGGDDLSWLLRIPTQSL